MPGSFLVREFRESRDSGNSRDLPGTLRVALAEFELALPNLQRFDPGLKSGGRNSKPGRRP
jgi:hypothetical protein